IRNALFPTLTYELLMNPDVRSITHRYLILKDPLFTQRKEKWVQDDSPAYLLVDADAIVIGENTKHPFIIKGQIGMSAMSYGSLVEHGIDALSMVLGIV